MSNMHVKRKEDDKSLGSTDTKTNGDNSELSGQDSSSSSEVHPAEDPSKGNFKWSLLLTAITSDLGHCTLEKR